MTFKEFLAWLFRRRQEPRVAPAKPAPVAARPVEPPEPASISLDTFCLEALNRSRPGPGRLLDKERIKHLAAGVLERAATETRLPAFPVVAVQVVELVQRGVPRISELVRLVNQDAALTAHLLRIANSAFYARGNEITSVRDAVTRMGFRDLADVASSAAAVALLTDPLQDAGAEFVVERRRLAVHSLACALGAAWLAMEHHDDSQQSFLDGLLHDVGKTRGLLALADLSNEGDLYPGEVEAALSLVLDATHVELGVSMAQAWKLPEHVQAACAGHHVPKTRHLHLIRLASGLAEVWISDWREIQLQCHAEVDESAAEMGLTRRQLTAALNQMKDFVARAGKLVDAT